MQDSEAEQKFNMVYLGKEFQPILESFGSRVLLDATYKVCRYTFNLFNLMVKTPQRYLVINYLYLIAILTNILYLKEYKYTGLPKSNYPHATL